MTIRPAYYGRYRSSINRNRNNTSLSPTTTKPTTEACKNMKANTNYNYNFIVNNDTELLHHQHQHQPAAAAATTTITTTTSEHLINHHHQYQQYHQKKQQQPTYDYGLPTYVPNSSKNNRSKVPLTQQLQQRQPHLHLDEHRRQEDTSACALRKKSLDFRYSCVRTGSNEEDERLNENRNENDHVSEPQIHICSVEDDVSFDASSLPSFGSIRPDPNYDPARDPMNPVNQSKPFIPPSEITIKTVRSRRRKTSGSTIHSAMTTSHCDHTTALASAPGTTGTAGAILVEKHLSSDEKQRNQLYWQQINQVEVLSTSETVHKISDRFNNDNDDDDNTSADRQQQQQQQQNKQRKGMIRREFGRRVLRLKKKKTNSRSSGTNDSNNNHVLNETTKSAAAIIDPEINGDDIDRVFGAVVNIIDTTTSAAPPSAPVSTVLTRRENYIGAANRDKKRMKKKTSSGKNIFAAKNMIVKQGRENGKIIKSSIVV